jgi:hypothetical protein
MPPVPGRVSRKGRPPLGKGAGSGATTRPTAGKRPTAGERDRRVGSRARSRPSRVPAARARGGTERCAAATRPPRQSHAGPRDALRNRTPYRRKHSATNEVIFFRWVAPAPFPGRSERGGYAGTSGAVMRKERGWPRSEGPAPLVHRELKTRGTEPVRR